MEQLDDGCAVIAQAIDGVGAQNEERRLALRCVAKASLESINGLTGTIRSLEELVGTEECSVALRCALAGVLAYFVMRFDVIPDDSPGGYGFTDDAILLRAGAVTYLLASGNSGEDLRKNQGDLGVLASSLNGEALVRCQARIAGITAAFNVFHGLPGGAVNEVLGEVLARPDDADFPEAIGMGGLKNVYRLGAPEALVEPQRREGEAPLVLRFEGGRELKCTVGREVSWGWWK